MLVLVTTNEPIRRLHPAVARAGRTAANIEFQPLTAEEANAWLEAHERDERVTADTTIAELYARLEGPGRHGSSALATAASRGIWYDMAHGAEANTRAALG